VSLDCVDCILNFETGANTLETGAVWIWEGGGSFEITGTIMDGATEVASGILLAGSFDGPVPAFASLGAGPKLTFSGTGFDQKNDDLLAYFGVANNEFIYANSEISAIGCTPGAGFGFSCAVDTADVTNTNIPGGGGGDVPEPGLLTLFGLGLLGAGRQVGRRIAENRQRG
jgi:hypothetical protein